MEEKKSHPPTAVYLLYIPASIATTNSISPAMAPSRTKTVKNKHAGNKGAQAKHANKKPGPPDGIVKAKKTKGTPPAQTPVGKQLLKLMEKRKKNRNKTYTDEELGIPKLNKITPVGVQKPRGKKKGKVFVDDRVSRHNFHACLGREGP